MKQNFRCAITGVELVPETTSPDHIIAKAIGGSNRVDNIQWVHIIPNRMKLELTPSDFVMWCDRVSKHARKKEIKETIASCSQLRLFDVA